MAEVLLKNRRQLFAVVRLRLHQVSNEILFLQSFAAVEVANVQSERRQLQRENRTDIDF